MEAIRQGDIPGVQLRRRRRLPHALELVWPWLTEPCNIERWLGRPVAVEPARWILAVEDPGEEPMREEILVQRVDPLRAVVLTLKSLDAGWDLPTRVALELSAVGDGCELSVLQRGFERLSLSDCLTIWERYRRRWLTALERLAGGLAEQVS